MRALHRDGVRTPHRPVPSSGQAQFAIIAEWVLASTCYLANQTAGGGPALTPADLHGRTQRDYVATPRRIAALCLDDVARTLGVSSREIGVLFGGRKPHEIELMTSRARASLSSSAMGQPFMAATYETLGRLYRAQMPEPGSPRFGAIAASTGLFAHLARFTGAPAGMSAPAAVVSNIPAPPAP